MRAALALLLVGCGAASIPAPAPAATRAPTVSVAASVLFPERPSLDAMAPARPRFFKQETWTVLSRGTTAQHCHEWAFGADEEASLRDEANASLASLGIAARFGGTIREDGIAASISTIDAAVLGEDRALVKLVVCTETEPAATARAFIAPFDARARATVGAGPAFGALVAGAAWERQYGDGRRRYGVRWSGDQEPLLRWMYDHHYQGERSTEVVLVRGAERVRFLSDIWWQNDATAP